MGEGQGAAGPLAAGGRSGSGRGGTRWRRPAGGRRRLAAGEADERVRLWVRVALGGERMTELAREFGYRDGSGVLQVVKRLEARAKDDAPLRRTLRRLRAAAAGRMNEGDAGR